MKNEEITFTEVIVYAIGIICGVVEFMFWLAMHVGHPIMGIPLFTGIVCLLYYLQHK